MPEFINGLPPIGSGTGRRQSATELMLERIRERSEALAQARMYSMEQSGVNTALENMHQTADEASTIFGDQPVISKEQEEDKDSWAHDFLSFLQAVPKITPAGGLMSITDDLTGGIVRKQIGDAIAKTPLGPKLGTEALSSFNEALVSPFSLPMRALNSYTQNIQAPVASWWAHFAQTQPNIVEAIKTGTPRDVAQSTILSLTPASGLIHGTAGLLSLGGEAEAARVAETTELFRQYEAGRIGFKDTVNELKKIQSSRPFWAQVLTESTSPVGMVENVLPVGKIGQILKGSRKIISVDDTQTLMRQADENSWMRKKLGLGGLEWDETGYPRVHGKELTSNQRIALALYGNDAEILAAPVNPEDLLKYTAMGTEDALKGANGFIYNAITEGKLSPGRGIRHIFNPNSEFVIDNPTDVMKYLGPRGIKDEVVSGQTTLAMTRVNSLGRYESLFDIEDGLTQNEEIIDAIVSVRERWVKAGKIKVSGDIDGRAGYMHEIMEKFDEPELRSVLSKEQKIYMNNIFNMFNDWSAQAYRRGVMPEKDLKELVDRADRPGRWFTQVWEQRLVHEGYRSVRKTPIVEEQWWQKQRVFKHFVAGLEAGENPLDFESTLNRFFRSAYSHDWDDHLYRIAGNKFAFTKRELMPHRLEQQVARIVGKKDKDGKVITGLQQKLKLLVGEDRKSGVISRAISDLEDLGKIQPARNQRANSVGVSQQGGYLRWLEGKPVGDRRPDLEVDKQVKIIRNALRGLTGDDMSAFIKETLEDFDPFMMELYPHVENLSRFDSLTYSSIPAARESLQEISKILGKASSSLNKKQSKLSELKRDLRIERKAITSALDGEFAAPFSDGFEKGSLYFIPEGSPALRNYADNRALEQFAGFSNSASVQKVLVSRKEISNMADAMAIMNNELPEGAKGALIRGSRIAKDTSGLMRSLQTSLDTGQLMIHLQLKLFARPKEWAATVGTVYNSLRPDYGKLLRGKYERADPTYFARFLSGKSETLKELIDTGTLSSGEVEMLSSWEQGGYLNRITSSMGSAGSDSADSLLRGATAPIRVTGKATQAAGEAFQLMYQQTLTAAKVYLYESLRPMGARYADELVSRQDFGETVRRLGMGNIEQLRKQNASPGFINAENQKIANELAKRAVGEQVAKATGSMSLDHLGVSKTTQDVLGGFIFYATRYRLSGYSMLLDLTRGGVQGEIARDLMGKWMASGLLTYLAVSMRTNQEPNLDPTSGKFLMHKVGDAYMGIGGVYVSVARMMSKFYDNVSDAKAGDSSWLRPLNPTDRDSWLHTAVRGQAAPPQQLLWDIVSERRYMGEPTGSAWDVMKSLPTEYKPFWLESLVDYPRAGFAGASGEFVGLRSYPVDLYTRASDTADNTIASKEYPYQWEDGTYKRFRDLTKLEKDMFLNQEPAIKAQFDESSQFWSRFQSGLDEDKTLYLQSLSDAAEEYEDTIRRASQIFDMGGSSTNFKLSRRMAAHDRSREYKKSREKYSEAYEKFQEAMRREIDRYSTDEKLKFVGDIAYQDYLLDIVLDEDINNSDLLSQYDFRQAEIREEEFKRKWGADVFEYVQQRLKLSASQNPREKELVMGLRVFKPYFQVGDLILERTGSPDQKSVWETYESMKASGVRNVDLYAFKQLHPWIKDIEKATTRARQAMREINPVLERWLYKWDYIDPQKPGESLRHTENQFMDPSDILDAQNPITIDDMIASLSQ